MLGERETETATRLRAALAVLCFLLFVSATGAPASAQDLDPSGGTYKPPASQRHRARTPTPRQPDHPSHPDPHPQPTDPEPPKATYVPSAEAERHYDLGTAAYDRNDLEKAVSEYEAAIKIDGKYTDAYIDLGAALYDLSDLDGAVDAWERALVLDKTIPELHNDLGNAAYVRHDYEKAVVEYKEAIKLRPTYYDALFGLGNTLAALKRYDEAIPYFQAAIDARGMPFPDARSNMAWAMLRAGKLADAEATARRAIDEIGPDSSQSVKAWYALAAVLTEKPDLPSAADALRKAVAVCAGCPSEQVSRIYYSLAKVLEAKGDRPGAANALEQYLRLAPYVTNADDVRRKIEQLRSS
jgi:tetratricopeptide (TPR) repeat protein